MYLVGECVYLYVGRGRDGRGKVGRGNNDRGKDVVPILEGQWDLTRPIYEVNLLIGIQLA